MEEVTKRQKTVLIPLLAAVIAAVAVAAAVFGWYRVFAMREQLRKAEDKLHAIEQRLEEATAQLAAAKTAQKWQGRDIRFFQDERLAIAFSYPAEWGDVKYQQLSGDGGYIDRTALGPNDQELLFTNPPCGDEFCNILVRFKEYNAAHPSYDECYEGGCWTNNLFDQKSQVETQANRTIGGTKARVFDSYFKPGGNVNRIYRFFTPKFRVEINGARGIFKLKNTETLEKYSGPDARLPSLFIDELVHANTEAFGDYFRAVESLVNTITLGPPASS